MNRKKFQHFPQHKENFVMRFTKTQFTARSVTELSACNIFSSHISTTWKTYCICQHDISRKHSVFWKKKTTTTKTNIQILIILPKL